MQARLHFCWIGPQLSWAYAFGVLSAAERSAMGEIILHHADRLEENGPLRLLRSVAGVTLRAIDPASYLSNAGHALGLGDRLVQIYAALTTAVMRADLLRAAILYTEGGIYLDLDTVTLASLLPLLHTRVFLGSEFIVWPRHVRQSRSPRLWARHLTLDVLRKACRQMPGGWRAFRHMQAHYVQSVNNAVMGAQANSGFLADYLRLMAAVPASRWSDRTALGPALLQDMVAQQEEGVLTIHPPAVFSPLPPEISEHWFRLTRRPDPQAVLLAETRVVHWYASVRTKRLAAQITPASVVENRHRQLYSALVYACIGGSAAFKPLVAKLANAA